MSNIVVNIHTEDGKTHSVDAPLDLKIADFTKEILEGLRITSDRQDHWELYDKSTTVALEPSRTLQENGVRTGQDLYLRLRQSKGVICRNCGTENPSGVSFCSRCGKRLAADTAPSDVKVHVHVPDGRIHRAEIPASLRAGEFASDLVRSLGLASRSPDGTEFNWILEHSETGGALDPDRTLGENGVRSGHHLNLRLFQPPPVPEPGKKDVSNGRGLRTAIVLGILVILGVAIYFAVRPKTPVVTVEPNAVALPVSQRQEFKASVNGSPSSEIQWSLEPEQGTISQGGVYTAPAKIPAKQIVKVIARSKANPRESATATIILEPGSKSLTVTPQQVNLFARQQIQFHAQGERGSSVEVQWSWYPALGSISSDGWYQAPYPILREQTVTVKATSKADASQSAVATVNLRPHP